MKRKKLKNRLGKKVLAGKMTVDEARRHLGRNMTQKSAVPSVAKAGSASQAAEAMRQAVAAMRLARPLTEQDLLDAARPLTRPPVTKAAAPPPRQDPREVLKALKSWHSPLDVPARPRPWTPAEVAMLQAADKMPTEDRERFRAGLIARREAEGKVL